MKKVTKQEVDDNDYGYDLHGIALRSEHDEVAVKR